MDSKNPSDSKNGRFTKFNYRLPIIWFICLIVIVLMAKKQLPKGFFDIRSKLPYTDAANTPASTLHSESKSSTKQGMKNDIPMDEISAASGDSVNKSPFFPMSVKDLLSKATEVNQKTKIVNMWATWCEPCKEELPWLLKIRKENSGKMDLILVSMDPSSQLDKAKFFLDSIGVDFETYFTSEKDETFIEGFSKDWSGTIPATFIFSSKGDFLTQKVGEVKEAELKELISQFL